MLEPEFLILQAETFIRDEYRCYFCGRQHDRPLIWFREITAEYPQNELDANLATICPDCYIIRLLPLNPLESFLIDVIFTFYKKIDTNDGLIKKFNTIVLQFVNERTGTY